MASPANQVIEIDIYSGLDHKTAMQGVTSTLVHTWVPAEDKRRLNAYVVLRALHEQVSRSLLRSDSVIDPQEIREYGDPATFAARVSAGVIGAEISMAVEGASTQLPQSPVLMDRPEAPLDPDSEGVLEAAHAAQVEVWKTRSMMAIEEWKAKHEAQPALLAAQAWLAEWAESDRAESKLREAYKENVQPCGDGVIQLTVEPGKMPETHLWDPEHYFPQFKAGEIVEFPDKVILAYEYRNPADKAMYIHRVSYELVERGEGAGGGSVQYPGHDTEVTCLLTDGHWKKSKMTAALSGGETLDVRNFRLDDAESFESYVDQGSGEVVLVRELDLGIDFIPVVHLPASPSSRTHFSRSLYTRGAQLIDDLQMTDAAVMSAANLAGNPPIVVSGALMQADESGEVQMGPGQVISAPERGNLSKLEMTAELKALSEHRGNVLERMSVVLQVPEGMLGQVSAEEVASGIALQLSFTPFQHLVLESRLALVPKLKLYLKMVMRLALVAKSPGYEDIESVPRASVRLGAFMPTDAPALVEQISSLRAEGVLPKSVAVAMLEAAGFELGDVEQLLNELDREDTQHALDLEAMFGPEKAAKKLGIEFDAEKHQQEKMDLLKAEAEAKAASNPQQPPGADAAGRAGRENGRARPVPQAAPGVDPAVDGRR